jgi:hypothetical protein
LYASRQERLQKKQFFCLPLRAFSKIKYPYKPQQNDWFSKKCDSDVGVGLAPTQTELKMHLVFGLRLSEKHLAYKSTQRKYGKISTFNP